MFNLPIAPHVLHKSVEFRGVGLFVLHFIICSLCVENIECDLALIAWRHSDIISWGHFPDLSKQRLCRTTKHDLCLSNDLKNTKISENLTFLHKNFRKYLDLFSQKFQVKFLDFG